jgi:protein TonB
MTYAYHWRKAMAISVCLHIFIVIAAGYLLAVLTAPLPRLEEVILEMDLISDPADRLEGNIVSTESPQLPDTPKPSLTEITPVTPLQTESIDNVPDSLVTTRELVMTAAEVPPSALIPNQSTTSDTTNTASPSAMPVSGRGSHSSIAAPGVLVKVDPIYPSAARQAGLEGTVILRIQILANGRPDEITIIQSTGYPVLDDAAVTAVRKWQFIPAKDRSSGRTIACTTTLPVSFRLH